MAQHSSQVVLPLSALQQVEMRQIVLNQQEQHIDRMQNWLNHPLEKSRQRRPYTKEDDEASKEVADGNGGDDQGKPDHLTMLSVMRIKIHKAYA